MVNWTQKDIDKKGLKTNSTKNILFHAETVIRGTSTNFETVKIRCVPLSVNKAWQGRRFKTDAYKLYEKFLMWKLPKKIDLPAPPYEIHFEFGFSSSLADWDNPVKPLQDILQKKYKFNDKLVKRAIVDVVDVAKGEEYFTFNIKTKI